MVRALEDRLVEVVRSSFDREDYDNEPIKESYGILSVYHLRYLMFTETECKRCTIVEYKGGDKIELICDRFTESNTLKIKNYLSNFHYFNLLDFIFMDEYGKVIDKKPKGYLPFEVDGEIKLLPKI